MFVLSPTNTANPGSMGGKAAALCSAAAAGMNIPDWFVITPDAFEASLSPAQRYALSTDENPEHLQVMLSGVSPSLKVIEEIEKHLVSMGDGLLAVRSSGMREDGADHSFAGQFESYLSVTRDKLPERIADVWRSGFSERVLAYRREHEIEGTLQAPAVLVQKMINSDTSGVAFSADPVTGHRSVSVVSAVRGLGTSLVGGDSDADTYRVRADGTIIGRDIASKTLEHRLCPDIVEGFKTREVEEPAASQPALSDEYVVKIAELARRAEQHFGRPQDIEWATHGDEVFVLQSRPVTSLGLTPDPDGTRNIWDNSNIVESYSGITTPLTFSFALHAYEGVYREFCRLMGVTEKTIAANAIVFSRMLGLIQGRVYYNLLNWYRFIALLPGYSFNRHFMEQMMGVKESLPKEISFTADSASRWERLVDLSRLCRTLMGLVGNQVRLPRMIDRFNDRLDQAFADPDPPLEHRRLDQLVVDYRALESSLLTRWDAPLVNDFFAMIFFGVLGRLADRWCSDEQNGNDSLRNDLVSGQGGMISAEPARRILKMGAVAATNPALTEVLRRGSVAEAVQALNRHEELSALYGDYLDIFGDRCLDELKLESDTLFDHPEPLVRSVGHAAARMARGEALGTSHQTTIKREAEQVVRRALARRPVRRAVFAWVLSNARARVRDRENLRFERTRLFGRVRRIFVEIGRRLFAEGTLDNPRDVFYLEVSEIVAYVEGAAPCDDLRGLAGVRRRCFDRYAEMETPAERFETLGAPYIANNYAPTASPTSEPSETGEADTLVGLGCYPGVVRGPARVIRDPRGAELEQGEILVAERTDPGWIMLFPSAAGILVERGSLLSHSAIVAREMGIPAVVSIPGLITRVENGQLIEMDGARGTVTLNTDPVSGI